VGARLRVSEVALPVGFIDFNTTYTIEVGVIKNGNTYFGNTCQVTTPPLVASISNNSCGAINQSTTLTQLVSTQRDGAPQGYLWELTNTSSGTVLYLKTGTGYTPGDYFFAFNPSFNNTVVINPIAVPGFVDYSTTYTFRSSLNYDMAGNSITNHGVWSNYCSFTTSPHLRMANPFSSPETKDFMAIATPNPFSSHFTVNVTTMDLGPVQIDVYDMIGKLVESKMVEASEAANFELGSHYASGLYNVHVTQGENKTNLKLVKS
jgi:hypothetical protein